MYKVIFVALFKSKGLATTQMSINRSLFKLWYIHTMDYSVTVGGGGEERGSSFSTDLLNPPHILGEKHTLYSSTVYYLLLYEKGKYESVFTWSVYRETQEGCMSHR